MDYNELRHFADSWGLVYLFVVFVGVILFTFRPGTRARADHVAKSILREDDHNVE